MSLSHHGRSVARRTVLVAAVGTASAVLPAARSLAAPGPAGNQHLRPGYDQQRFEFETVTLRGSNANHRWQRRVSATAPWHDLGIRGRTYTFRPTWRDVGASYRALGGGPGAPVTTILAPVLEGLDPASFGAVGDGRTDDTTALNAALAEAARLRTGVDLNGRSYAVSSHQWVRNGVTAVFNGRITQTAAASALYLGGKTVGFAENVSGCVIHGVHVDLFNGPGTWGIAGASVSHVAVVGCTIENPDSPGTGILLYNTPAGGRNVEDLVVRSNRITVAVDGVSDIGHGVYIDMALDILGHPSMPAYWRATWSDPIATWSTSKVDVVDNDITGGYYAIAMYGPQELRVEANTCRRNIRNISLQYACNGAVVRDNLLFDSISSSIHLAYGSSDNLIENNTITTATASGEGLLQAYVNTQRNRFVNNVVTSTSPSGPKWMIYCAVHADGNVFEGNQLSGTCSKAYIGIEAAWDSTNTHVTHRGTGIPEVDHFANRGMADVRIVGNVIDPQSSEAELICLADIDDPWGQWRLDRCVVRNNRRPAGTIKPHRYVG